MQSWDDIINIAMIGSDKKMIAANELPVGLTDAASIILDNTTTGKEEKFLQIASLVFNYRQSGVMPLQKEHATLSIAQPEEKMVCSKLALQVLKNILVEESIPLLKFWLQHCNDNNKIIPPEMVPGILTIGEQQKNMQPTISSCCGKRGEWLSHINDSWNFASSQDDESTWLTGTIEQRKIIFKEIRNNDPAKARAWLQQVWPQEDAATKLIFLEIFSDEINEGDISFLETMATEKSKKIKDEALKLLKQIPSSPTVLQYQQLLHQTVMLKKEKALFGLSSKMILQFNLPGTIDDTVFKSGIDKLSNQKEYTDDEFIIYQLIQSVPPSFWETQLESKPEDIVSYFQKDTTGKKMMQALIIAIKKFNDKRWASIMIQSSDTFYIDLIPMLPLPLQETYGIKYFENYADSIILYALERGTEWSLDFTNAVFRHTAKNIYQYNRSFYNQHIYLIPDKIALSLEKFTPTEAHLQGSWSNISEYILKLLQLKSQTIQSFN